MSKTGIEFVTDALRELQVLDPTADASGEHLADGLRVANDLLDTWAVNRLLVGGAIRSQYTLTNAVAAYTIGTDGAFNQTYPEVITAWSIVPDGTLASPVEVPRGRPVTAAEWQRIAIKSQTGQPRTLWFDRAYAAGLGTCTFHPIPNTNAFRAILYSKVPAIRTLVAGTTYDLQPGMQNALTLNLALALIGRYGKGVTLSGEERINLRDRAVNALAAVERANIVPQEAGRRAEFSLGGGRRTFNIRTDW